MGKAFKVSVVVLLGGTLVVQLMILQRMRDLPPGPVTVGDLRSAPPAMRRELRMRAPLVSVDGPVSVEVDGPIDCSIMDVPLEVQIVR